MRDALRRVWSLSTSRPTLDLAIQEIFYGMEKTRKTHDLVKGMGIAPLTHHLSTEEVERRLDELLKDPKAQGCNSRETLSLLALLPVGEKRASYAPLLDLDPRPYVDITIKAYLRSLRKVVNPEGKEKSVIYGCSGADGMSILLSTDANDLTFVDLTNIQYEDIQKA